MLRDVLEGPDAPQAEVRLHLGLSLARLSSLLLLRALHFSGDPSCPSARSEHWVSLGDGPHSI